MGDDKIQELLLQLVQDMSFVKVSDVPAVLRDQVVDILKDVLEVEELPEELL